MGLVIRLYNIVSPNAYTVSVKEGNNPYPLDSGYTNVTGTLVNGVFTITSQHYKFNTQYFVKLTDNITGRYIIENIYENDPIAYMDCAPQPLNMTLECTHDYYPPEHLSALCPPDPTPTPTATYTPTPTTVPPTNTPIPTTSAPPTFTPIPSGPGPTQIPPNYYVVRRCDNSVTGIVVNTPATFLQLNYSYTLTGSHPQMDGVLCWEVTDIVHTGAQYNVSFDQEYANCRDCTVTYFDAYTGSSLSAACAQTTSHRIWYHGTLGVDTVLYNDSAASVPVDFGFYYYNTDVVLEVGRPSVEDGRVTVSHSCSELPTPTPTPIPQGYFTGYVSDGTATEACLGGIFGGDYHAFAFDTQGSYSDDLCNATYITTENYGYDGDIIKPMSQGGKYDMNTDFYIASGGFVRQWRRSGNSSHATPISSCTSCSGGATPTPIPYTNTPIPNTPTPIPLGTSFTAYYGSTGQGGTGTACNQTNSFTLYPAFGQGSYLSNGRQYYYSNGAPFDGSGYPAISDGVNEYGYIGSDGIYHYVDTCV